jgi:hypothetical protein
MSSSRRVSDNRGTPLEDHQDSDQDTDGSSDTDDERKVARDLVSPSRDEFVDDAAANAIEQEVRRVSREEIRMRFGSGTVTDPTAQASLGSQSSGDSAEGDDSGDEETSSEEEDVSEQEDVSETEADTQESVTKESPSEHQSSQEVSTPRTSNEESVGENEVTVDSLGTITAATPPDNQRDASKSTEGEDTWKQGIPKPEGQKEDDEGQPKDVEDWLEHLGPQSGAAGER